MEKGDRGGGGVLVVPPVTPSQKERVGGSGGLRPGLGWHAHQGLGHGHPHASDSADPDSGHHAGHGRHTGQGDHGDGLSG